MKIKSIHAREILDSRGNPTVACKVTLTNGVSAEAMVPSGASTGVHEALELRDNDKKRYNGKGTLKAVNNVNKIIAPKLIGKDAANQKAIDELMIKLDGTENKDKLGANAILGVSLACARASAQAKNQPLYKYIHDTYKLPTKHYKLPYPMMNILNGGKHADSGLEIQEFMVVPQAKKLHERVRQGAEVFHALKKILTKAGQSVGVGDEGGFAPHLHKNEDALIYIKKAIEEAGYVLGRDINLALDAAASEFYLGKNKYKFDKKKVDAKKLMEVYEKWVDKYHMISMEDGIAEDDWDNWWALTRRLGKKIHLIGDDLFVTNIKRLQMGIERKVGNAILIKLNQIGTLTETVSCITLAQKNKYKVVVSHRSGETEDTTIADLAVAVSADYIKTGSLCRTERVSKYNRLMQIEEELN
ncbi:MAG: phosphopyruvate hydratase [Patescibacteria group bacterium]|jgi:enolase